VGQDLLLVRLGGGHSADDVLLQLLRDERARRLRLFYYLAEGLDLLGVALSLSQGADLLQLLAALRLGIRML